MEVGGPKGVGPPGVPPVGLISEVDAADHLSMTADAAEPGAQDYVLNRFFELPTRQQLAAYRVIRDRLSSRIQETKRDRVVEDRAATIEAIEAVAAHLGLEGRAPTPNEFDAGARALGLKWRRGHVQRVWGRWRFAKAVYLREYIPPAAHAHDRRLPNSGGGQRRLPPLECLRRWLASKPASRATTAYLRWAREYNAALTDGDLPVVAHTGSITRPLQMTWPDAVRFAAGEIKRDEARPIRRQPRNRFCRGPHQLVSRTDLVEIIGGTSYSVHQLVAQPAFPRPVVALGRNRFWLRSDIESYAKGEPVPTRRENQLRDVYMTSQEVAAMSGFSHSKVSAGKGGLPPRAVRLGAIDLWLRDELEDWLAKTKRERAGGERAELASTRGGSTPESLGAKA